mmetsp:Transcript_32311/g.36296  ORF Transcript_32311/g.36296 Transcript_32311/m.36296 type:complete len:80 (-) Transcript_32311:7-246(-)
MVRILVFCRLIYIPLLCIGPALSVVRGGGWDGMGEKGKDGNSMRCCLSNRHKMTTSSSLSITRAKMNTNTNTNAYTWSI